MDGLLEVDVLIYPDGVRLARPEDIREWELEAATKLALPSARLFVALYPYNPAAMSPNRETAAAELPFVPGQIIKVRPPVPSVFSTWFVAVVVELMWGRYVAQEVERVGW